MRRETEMYFGYIVREDRSVLELIESDYTFLNERLAKHYGLTNLSVTGTEMRRVTLPADSPRGGVLTHRHGAGRHVESQPHLAGEARRVHPRQHSCYNRMDPLGLALENFNAMGMWRTQELRQPVDGAAKLITGGILLRHP